jgi:hypothetical protein
MLMAAEPLPVGITIADYRYSQEGETACTDACLDDPHITVKPVVEGTGASKTFSFTACSDPSLLTAGNAKAGNTNAAAVTAAADLVRLWQLMGRTISHRTEALHKETDELSVEAEQAGMQSAFEWAQTLHEGSPDCRRKMEINFRSDSSGDLSAEAAKKAEAIWSQALMAAQDDEERGAALSQQTTIDKTSTSRKMGA